MNLSELKKGESAFISVVGGTPAFRLRLEEMGFIPGQEVTKVYSSPIGTPIVYSMLGQKVALRKSEAARITIETSEQRAMEVASKTFSPVWPDSIAKGEQRARSCGPIACGSCPGCGTKKNNSPAEADELTIALVGNPNCGKTAFFNAASGGHERTGNYAGVTVSSVVGRTTLEGRKLRIVDLPGTYSLQAYSPEEAFVANELNHGEVDVIVNVLDVNNLERNLLLTMQLKKYGLPVVCALNVFDEFEKNGSKLDIEELKQRLGFEMIPTVASKSRGVKEVLQAAIAEVDLHKGVEYSVAQGIKNENPHTAVHELLKNIYTLKEGRPQQLTKRIDMVLASSPLAWLWFVVVMGLVFYATFELGAYPMDWMDAGVAWISELINSHMDDGWLRALLVDGVIGGVGGVIVFLPNILILYFFISILEDSGYLARAAMLADPLLRRVGLHGKSFIPMIMGFGCSVPSVMATRTIESRKSRLITMMTLPFISCSARLPVYTVLAGAFFPQYAAWVMLALYFGGIGVAFAAAWVLNQVFRRSEECHFVMEMPTYRMPVAKSVLRHTWEKGRQYLKKMGGIILLASIVVWALGYFPVSENDVELSTTEQQEQSYLGRIGHAMEPVISPLGYDWRMGVGILAGVGAKELMVSTLGVLYDCPDEVVEDETLLQQALRSSGMTPEAALSYMVFALLYFPCLATIAAIRAESGRWKYAVFSALYTTGLAWCLAWVVYQVALMF